MRPRLPSSVLVLSVDWQSPVPQASHQEAFSADKLIRLLQRYELATTWSVRDPHTSPLPDLLQAASVTHDVSLLASEAWAAPDVDRRQFGAQLQERLGAARARGVPISTLTMPTGRPVPHVDLIQKCAMNSVRADDLRSTREHSGQPYAIRYGLWNVPASRTLPEQQRWMWNSSASGRRMIQSVMAGQVMHVVIAGDQFAGQRFQDLRTLEMVLRNLAEAQQAGRLQVETVSQFVQRLNTHQRTSARSILRKAA